MVNQHWLVGGAYGEGERIKLSYTRTMITVALAGDLEKAVYVKHPVFGLQMPSQCPGIPAELLNPQNTWKDKKKYDETAYKLAEQFIKNFESYKEFATEEILAGGPVNIDKEKTKATA